MTKITTDTVELIAQDALPERWAADLAIRLAPNIGEANCDLLQDRVVGLGHGVQLSHIRTHHVHEPTLGAWKATDVGSEDTEWLWLVVLIPSGDPSKHLGWMAHLAAGLHESHRREAVFAADSKDGLLDALQRMLAPREASQPNLPVQRPASEVAAPASVHRLVVAILKEVEMVDHLLSLFVEHEVRGATVLEARGMAEHLSAHMSLFAGFRSAFKAVGHSQLILTVVPSDRTNEVLELVREAAGGMRTPGSGVAFALDVPMTVGFDKFED